MAYSTAFREKINFLSPIHGNPCVFKSRTDGADTHLNHERYGKALE